VSDIFGLICLATYTLVVFSALRRDEPVLLVFGMAFLVLYVGQYFTLGYLYTSEPVIYTLYSWGYTETAATLLNVYLIYVGLVLLVSSHWLGRPKVPFMLATRSFSRQNLFHVIMVTVGCLIYVSIVGLEGLYSVRPNLMQGATSGTVLILSFGLCVNVMLFSRGVSPTVYAVLIAVSLFMLIMSGSWIYVLYLLGTSVLTIHHRYNLRLGLGLFLLSILAIFSVLILGQSVKEYFGGNLVFDDYMAAVLWTTNNFYVAQVEGFSGSASIIQKIIDTNNIPFSLGINAVGSLLLLLPGFIRPNVDLPIAEFVFYDSSIVPSAVESFIEYFGPLSIFLHGFSLFLVLYIYRLARASPIDNRRSAYVLVFKFYLVVSSLVLLTRGPIDLIWFTIIPPAVVMYLHYLLGSRWRL
jgi:hypothetical protein